MPRGRPRRRAHREVIHRSDLEIRRDLTQRIHADPRLAGAEVTVEVRGARVQLRGAVPSMLARLAAIADGWAVPGVRDVCHSELMVGRPRDLPIPVDGRLEASLRRRLSNHPDLSGTRIQVTARGGHVVLEGLVREPRAAAVAADLVAQHAGVTKVDNLIGNPRPGKG
jgi:hyperosmotically inducible protein